MHFLELFRGFSGERSVQILLCNMQLAVCGYRIVVGFCIILLLLYSETRLGLIGFSFDNCLTLMLLRVVTVYAFFSFVE